jgi:hypothetical protein
MATGDANVFGSIRPVNVLFRNRRRRFESNSGSHFCTVSEHARNEHRQLRRVHGADLPEEKLVGGDVTEGVVRVGDTVRRPLNAQSGAIHAYLRHASRI